MQRSGYPSKFSATWASSASGSYVLSPIPASGAAAGRATLQQGFPPVCFQPVGSGGTPPYGADVNGVLQMLSAQAQADQAGAVPVFDGTFSGNISGYPKGCIVASPSVSGLFWVSTADSNTTDPEGGSPANWISFRAGPSVLGLAVLAPTGGLSVTVPAGVYLARVRLWGAGANGGAGSGGAGGGGGGGGYAEGYQTVVPGTVMTAVLYTGGNSGSTCTFGTFSATNGQTGGGGSSGSIGNGGSPGQGYGTGNLRAGTPGSASINLGGGTVLSGTGGAVGGGAGQGGQFVGGTSSTNLNGVTGQNPGGGGSGGVGTGTGGVGADSLCLVEWLT